MTNIMACILANILVATRLTYSMARDNMLPFSHVWRHVSPDAGFAAGLALFAAAKALKYWAIASLGPRWTFRILVPPGSTRTAWSRSRRPAGETSSSV